MAWRIASPLVAGVLALVVSSCGGTFAGGDESKTPPQNPLCSLRPARLNAALPKRVALKRPVRIDLSKVTGGRATRVAIAVRRATSPTALEDSFTNSGRFMTGSANRFVSVTFTLKNLGDKPIEAANSVNESFVIADTKGHAWLRADGDEKCRAVSPSAATRAGIASPESDIGPGDQYDTIAVYVVPRRATDLSWVGPGVRFPLKPR